MRKEKSTTLSEEVETTYGVNMVKDCALAATMKTSEESADA